MMMKRLCHARAPLDDEASVRKRPSGERGSVLVLTLLLTLVILGIGLMAMWMATSTTKVSGNLVRRQEAMQAARAGLSQARAILLSLGGSGGWGNNPNYSPALRGTNCTTPPADHTAMLGALIPGKGRILCAGTSPSKQGDPLVNVPIVDPTSQTFMAHGVAVTELQNVTFTAYVRNDDDEYRWCDGKQDYGETDANGDCDNNGADDSNDEFMRMMVDDDSRIILRVEAHGRDGLSFAAVEAIISGRVPVVIKNGYSQSGSSSGGQNGNNIVLR